MMNMMQNCSISEKEQVEDSQGCDLLSDLPLGIIHTILALIPIRDAVRTSVLSAQWRYTWTTLPELVFDRGCASDESKSKYEDIILQVLSLHKGPIRRFKLSCFGHFRYVDQWLTCLSRNGIQEIIINSFIVIQSSLYSCEMLTYLSLNFCTWEPPPMNFKGFLFMRFLCIGGKLFLGSDDISRIVAACPLLEGFATYSLAETLEIKLSAPNLKYIRLVGKNKKICINAPHVTEIGVYMPNFQLYRVDARNQQLKKLACEYVSCLAGFTNLQELRGIGSFIKFMSLGIELCHHPLVFHHLKLISVEVNFNDVKEIMVLARLLIGAPSLQELVIRSVTTSLILESEVPHLPLEFKLKNLKDVSLIYLNAFPLEDEFLKNLFESSPVLETVRVDTEKDQNKVRAILQGCNLVSGLSPPIVKLGVNC